MIRLEPDEKILLTVRKHWFVLLSETFYLVFLLLAPFLIGATLQILDIETMVNIGGSINAFLFFLGCIWLMFVWISFFVIWTDYYLDILIVTNKQIIDVEQRGLFSRELSTFRLDRIQDVTSEVDGIIQTFFDFGTIHIQTASEDQDFQVFGVPRPFEIKHFISKKHDLAMEQLKTVHISQESLQRLRNTPSPEFNKSSGDV